MTFLLKKEDVRPESLSPIGVATITYRAWSAIRYRHLEPWALQVCHPNQTAYRPGVDVPCVNLQRSLLVERSVLTGTRVILASFDLREAFDYVPHGALTYICSKTGLPPALLRMLQNRFQSVQIHWKLCGSLSHGHTMRRGIVQGDALSCLWFNTLLAPLAWFVSRVSPEGPLLTHVDDLFLQTAEHTHLVRSYAHVAQYLRGICVPLQSSKTQILRTCASEHPPLDLGDQQVQPTSVEVLGQTLTERVGARHNLLP